MTITIEVLEKKHDELGALIESFKAQRTTISVAAVEIALRPGEHYAGAVLDEAGRVLHHLVLLAGKGEELELEQAKKWAADAGGELPTRQEQALLFANCRPHLATEWHWSSEAHETNSSWTWGCDFYYGLHTSNRSSAELSAVAVRRIR